MPREEAIFVQSSSIADLANKLGVLLTLAGMESLSVHLQQSLQKFIRNHVFILPRQGPKSNP